MRIKKYSDDCREKTVQTLYAGNLALENAKVKNDCCLLDKILI
jgi:hypothetical protein